MNVEIQFQELGHEKMKKSKENTVFGTSQFKLIAGFLCIVVGLVAIFGLLSI
jgi:hypothetical protein